VTLLSCPSIDDHHLMSEVSHSCWIKRTQTLTVGQVIRWIRLNRHIMQVLTFACIMAIQSKSTISGVTPYPLTSMATTHSASTTIIVIKNEDFKLFSVERQLISYQ
jgi:hypothetical protein